MLKNYNNTNSINLNSANPKIYNNKKQQNLSNPKLLTIIDVQKTKNTTDIIDIIDFQNIKKSKTFNFHNNSANLQKLEKLNNNNNINFKSRNNLSKTKEHFSLFTLDKKISSFNKSNNCLINDNINNISNNNNFEISNFIIDKSNFQKYIKIVKYFHLFLNSRQKT